MPEQRREKQQRRKQHEAGDRNGARETASPSGSELPPSRSRRRPAQPQAGHGAQHDSADLADRAWREQHQDGGSSRDGGARAIRAE